MGTRTSVLVGTPAWALSLFTAIGSLVLPFLFAGIVSLIGGLFGIEDEEFGNFIAYLCTGIVVAVMCFLICKWHPKTVWHTPILSNALTIVMGIANPVPFGIGWGLSIIAAVAGYNAGRGSISDT